MRDDRGSLSKIHRTVSWICFDQLTVALRTVLIMTITKRSLLAEDLVDAGHYAIEQFDIQIFGKHAKDVPFAHRHVVHD